MPKIEVYDVNHELDEYENASAIRDGDGLIIIDLGIQGDAKEVFRTAVLAEYAPGYWAMWRVIKNA